MSTWDADRLAITSLAVRDECAVLRLRGELDHGSEEFYLDSIGAVVVAGYRYLILDVTALVFCDSRGLNCLLALRWLLRRREGRLLLACVGRHMAGLLALTGSTGMLPVYPSVSEALQALPSDQRPQWPPADGRGADIPDQNPQAVESSWRQHDNPHLPPGQAGR